MPLEKSEVSRYTAEFIGTFLLVFTVGCNVITGQSVWGGVSIACVLTVMIYALGKSSGANFNPAVSLALGLTKKLLWKEVGIYVAVQSLAGIAAGFCYVLMFGQEESFNLGPTEGHSLWQAGLAEILYTFMLCFVVLNVACSKVHGVAGHQFYGLAIGFVIVAGAYSGGSVSMGCFNPAVAMGIDIGSFDKGLFYGFVYPVFELIGAAMAAGLFLVCRPDERLEDHEHHKAKAIQADYPLSSKLVSEFLGTYMLVLTVGLNVLSGSAAGAFSIAAALMCMIFALGTVSGAHFNPAVTAAIVCSGRNKISPKDAGAYVGIQLLAGVLAAFTYSAMMNGETFALKPPVSAWSQVVAAELIFTFVLAFVVLSVATVKNPLTEYFGFAIGMCVTVGGFAIGKVSGGSLNPAVSVAISSSHLMSAGGFWPCLVYSAVELAAGAMAAGAFFVTQPSEYELDDEKSSEAEKEPLVAKSV